jgi:hypothetical protein
MWNRVKSARVTFATGGLSPISSTWRQASWDSGWIILFSNWTLAVIVLMEHHFWREDRSVVHNCWWASPAQALSGPSPMGLMTIFYCLRFESLSTWRARSPFLCPPGTGWSNYIPRHWVPFSSSPTTCKAMVEVFDHTSTRETYVVHWSLTRIYITPTAYEPG